MFGSKKWQKMPEKKRGVFLDALGIYNQHAIGASPEGIVLPSDFITWHRRQAEQKVTALVEANGIGINEIRDELFPQLREEYPHLADSWWL